MFYFAYGSNLNKKRMLERGVIVNNIIPAKLFNYELKFNKVSKQGAVANISPCENSCWGCLVWCRNISSIR
jgi:hypothetical protein